MPQTLCSLGGFTYLYNPYPNVNYPVKRTAYNPSFGGGFQTTYLFPGTGGTFKTDREIKQTWDYMDRSFYVELETLFEEGGTLTYVDPFGTSWTVIFTNLTYSSFLKGGDEGVEKIEVKLRVVSQP